MSVSESSRRTRANSNIRQYGCSQIGLAFRTNQTAPPQACTLIGAAAMPEIDGDQQHTMRAVPIGAGGSSPDVRQGPCGGRRAGLAVTTPRIERSWELVEVFSAFGCPRAKLLPPRDRVSRSNR